MEKNLLITSGSGTSDDVLVVLNFGHAMTNEQQQKVLELTQKGGAEVIDCACQFDLNEPLLPQVISLIQGIKLSPEEWQTRPIVVVPPGMSSAACVVMAVLQGLMGYFPPIVRLVQAPNTTPPKFVVREIIDLTHARQEGRTKRTKAE